ncbi:MAG: iron-sulfur cluster assembly scaffold protein [Candidatus Pacearchaeota archaeon]|nr:iron-sulfur cluster assembly scaffold protein [Candidatus Pacearchaeota archaeon]
MGIEKIIEYYKNPKNRGKIENPDAIGEEIGSCGDTMAFFVKIGKKKVDGKEVDYIKDIKFDTLGCAVAVASASATTELVKGKTIPEAKKISEQDIAKKLGDIPEAKFHCIDLTLGTLRNTINNWEKKNKK